MGDNQMSIVWAPVVIVLINMIGSIALAWIRAKYGIKEEVSHNGKKPTDPTDQ